MAKGSSTGRASARGGAGGTGARGGPAGPTVAVTQDAIRVEASKHHGIATIPDVFDRVRRETPGVTLEEFKSQLTRWARDDKVILQIVNDPRLEPRFSERTAIRSPFGGYYYYLAVRD